MRRSLRGMLSVALALAALIALPDGSAGRSSENGEEDFGKAIVSTDGRLRPGHLEPIWVHGFPGRGRTEVAFFPTAICENECGALGGGGGMTDDSGSAHFRVRVPNGFINSRQKFTPFRDRERIDVQVIWTGPDDGVDVGNADPDPIVVRVHRGAVKVAGPTQHGAGRPASD